MIAADVDGRERAAAAARLARTRTSGGSARPAGSRARSTSARRRRSTQTNKGIDDRLDQARLRPARRVAGHVRRRAAAAREPGDLPGQGQRAVLVRARADDQPHGRRPRAVAVPRGARRRGDPPAAARDERARRLRGRALGAARAGRGARRDGGAARRARPRHSAQLRERELARARDGGEHPAGALRRAAAEPQRARVRRGRHARGSTSCARLHARTSRGSRSGTRRRSSTSTSSAAGRPRPSATTSTRPSTSGSTRRSSGRSCPSPGARLGRGDLGGDQGHRHRSAAGAGLEEARARPSC